MRAADVEQLLKLPQGECAAMAAILGDSFQHQPSTVGEASWIAEATRHLEAGRAGKSPLIPTEVVEDELDVVVRAIQSS